MKNSFFKAIVLTTFVSINLGMGPVVKAQEVQFDTQQSMSSEMLSNLELEMNEKIALNLNKFISENKLKVTIENPTVEINENVIYKGYNEEIIKDKISEDIEQFKENLYEMTLNTGKTDAEKKIINNGSYYTARVWSGVPAIGHGYINQDFRVTISGGRVISTNFLGSSYSSGFLIGTWSHNRSWAETRGGGTLLDIYMRGTLRYGIGDFSYNYPATFLDNCRVSGNRLVNV
ncbi:hypothetical protein Q3F30_09485 [Enterococcus faecium]|nr:hypothetical protein [Enterococcus faecium]